MARQPLRKAVFQFAVLGIGCSLVLAPWAWRVHGAQVAKGPAAASSALPPELAELVAAHNRERAAEKLEPLTPSAKLTAAALGHARDMAEHDKMTHDGSDGSKFNERIEREGYQGRRLGENVAEGQRSVEEVMRVWMASPHHREIILRPFTEIGVAYATSDNGKRYWCTTFGLPRTRLDRDEAAAGVVAAINRARAAADKPPLHVSPKLTKAAQTVAEALAAQGDLEKAETTHTKEATQVGYRFRLLGEAAASGQSTPDEAVDGWLTQPGHRNNFLGRFSDIGAGYAVSEKGLTFWMVFLAQPLPK
jgi:uncharacterized protein YkwD